MISEGTILPLIINYTDKSHIKSYQLHVISNTDTKKVLKKKIKSNMYLSNMSNELLNIIIAIMGGNITILSTVSHVTQITNILEILKYEVDK